MSSFIYIVSLYWFQIGPSQAWHDVVWYSKKFYDMVEYDKMASFVASSAAFLTYYKGIQFHIGIS